MNTRYDVEKATFRYGFAKSGAPAGPRGALFGPRLGHVFGRGTRHVPVSQCEIARRGGALRRHFSDVQKATSRCCFAKYVTPAEGGQKHAPLLLWSSNAKSPKIGVVDFGRSVESQGRGQRSRVEVKGPGSGLRSAVVGSAVFGLLVFGLRSFGLGSLVATLARHSYTGVCFSDDICNGF